MRFGDGEGASNSHGKGILRDVSIKIIIQKSLDAKNSDIMKEIPHVHRGSKSQAPFR